MGSRVGALLLCGHPVWPSCVAIQPAVRRLDDRCKAVGGLVRFGIDDGYAVGPMDVVLDAVQRFAE